MPVGEFDYAKALVPVFLSLYEQSQAMLKRFNPCNVCDGVCERHRRGHGENFCCKGCVYLGPQGCQVKALQCALWICRYDLIPNVNKKAWEDTMWGIMLEANKFNLLVPRGGMEASIAQACRYYIDHRDERDALMKAADVYKPRPCFFPPPVQSSSLVKRWFGLGPLGYAPRSFEPTGSHKPESVLPSRMTGYTLTPEMEKELLKPAIPAEEHSVLAASGEYVPPAKDFTGIERLTCEAKASCEHFDKCLNRLVPPGGCFKKQEEANKNVEESAAESECECGPLQNCGICTPLKSSLFPNLADTAFNGAVMKDSFFAWPN